jgi:hypothetical protein
VYRQRRRDAPQQRHRAHVLHDHRVHARSRHGAHARLNLRQLGVVKQNVHRDKAFHARRVQLGHEGGQLCEREVLGARARVEGVQAEVDGVGAARHGGAQLRPAASRGEHLRLAQTAAGRRGRGGGGGGGGGGRRRGLGVERGVLA